MKRRQLYSCFPVLFLAMALVQTKADLFAQQHRELDSVTIYATPKFLQLSSPLAVQTLADSALKRLNVFSVADALRYFAGVQLKDYGGVGGLKTVDIRNMGTNHTGLLYDGVPIENSQNGQVDLGKFSLENMQEISLYNAGTNNMLQPASAYASGAAIYLTTKTPVFQNQAKTHVNVAFKTGSFGLVNPSVLLQQKLNSTFSILASAERTAADGRYRFTQKVQDAYDTTATRENADIHSWRAELGLFGKLKDSSGLHTQVYYYTSDRGLPGAIVNNKYYNPQRLWDKNFFAQSKYDRKVNNFYRFAITAKYAYDYTHYFDPTIVGVDGMLNNYYRLHQAFLSVANAFTLSKYWKMQFSTDYKQEYLNANLYNFVYPTRNSILAVVATQYQNKKWVLQGNLLGSFIYDKVRSGQKTTDRREYTPTIDFSWQPFSASNFKVRGFYKNIFRMPTFNDLYYTGIVTVNLNPEFAKQYDVGCTYWKILDKKGSFFSCQVDGFHNDVKDKIIALPAQNLFRWKMVNLGKVESNGVTASVKNEWHWTSSFISDISLQYTYEDSKNRSVGNAYGAPVPYTPLNSGTVIVNTTWHSWELNYSCIYTGSRYNVTDVTLPYSRLQPWYTHDLGLVKKISSGPHHFRCVAEISNLFNQQYEVILNYPMPGRNYRFGIYYNI